jgi:ABC-type Zn2+ transport system substrate-binding protein/surface adhesin
MLAFTKAFVRYQAFGSGVKEVAVASATGVNSDGMVCVSNGRIEEDRPTLHDTVDFAREAAHANVHGYDTNADGTVTLGPAVHRATAAGLAKKEAAADPDRNAAYGTNVDGEYHKKKPLMCFRCQSL